VLWTWRKHLSAMLRNQHPLRSAHRPIFELVPHHAMEVHHTMVLTCHGEHTEV